MKRKNKSIFSLSLLLLLSISACGEDETTSSEVAKEESNEDNSNIDENYDSSNHNTLPSDFDKDELYLPEEDYPSVTWLNYDDSVIYSQDNLEKNSLPVFNHTIPERPSDDKYLYEFVGWNKEIVPIKHSTTYKAVFEAKEYGIYYIDETNVKRHISWEETIDKGYLKFTPNSTALAFALTNNPVKLGNNVEVVVSNTITALNDYCFREIDNISAVLLPTTITEIKSNSINSLKYLEKITIPSSITSYGSRLFDNNVSLKEINILAPITELKDFMFNGCTSIEQINIPESVTTIGNGVFNNCNSLKELYIPENVVNINDEDSLCSNVSKLESIIVDENNEVFDSRNNCNAIIRSETNALIQGCKNTIIDKSVTRICKYAFNNISTLTHLTIPENIEVFDSLSINNCANLKTNLYHHGKYLGSNKNPYMFLYELDNPKSLTSFEFNENVEYINDGVFSNALDIKKLHITKKIKKISTTSLHSQLEEITVAEDNPIYDSRESCDAIIETETNTLIQGCKNSFIPEGVEIIGEGAFKNVKINSVVFPNSIKIISNNAFYSCQANSIILNQGLEVLGEYCFAVTNITEFIIPEGIKIIPDYCLYSCNKLITLYLPSTLEQIGRSAFYCGNIKTVFYSGSSNQFQAIEKNKNSYPFGSYNPTIRCSDGDYPSHTII